MLTFAKQNGISFAGVDMQNSTELKSEQQMFQFFITPNARYQARIRKSADSLSKWGGAMEDIKQLLG